MKDDLAFKQSKRLGHTRQHAWDPFAALAQAGVKAGGGADAIFGTKPKVAEYKATDLGEEAGRAVGFNLKNYPQIAKLLESILPGYTETMSTGMKSAAAMSRGEIPKDVQDQVRRSSAFRSLMGGFGGSGMSRALGARDFGKTSLDMQERGQNAAQRWASLASGLSSPYMVSAAGAADASFRNKILQQQNQQDIYNVAAAPDPGKKGTFDLQFALGMTAASIGAGMLGGSAQGEQPGKNTDKSSTPGGSGTTMANVASSSGGIGGVQPYNYSGGTSTIGNNMSYQPWYMNSPAPAAPANTGGYSSQGPWADTYGWG